jgi:hypothetical protein
METAPLPNVSLAKLRSALEVSWDRRTAHLQAHQPGNPALGQCYPSARLVQWFFPSFEIASGRVETGSSLEWHFWNIDPAADPARHVDLTWQQFAEGSKVVQFEILDRHALNDSRPTIERCQLLLERVLMQLGATAAIDLSR